jgi:hypothetical protein
MPGLLCVKTCCTTDDQCGYVSAATTNCVAADAKMCPNPTIFGQVSPACCVPGTNDCGVVNTISGDPPCVARQDVPIAPLDPLHCDGTPVETPDGGGGMGGMGGAGGGDPADAGL